MRLQEIRWNSRFHGISWIAWSSMDLVEFPGILELHGIK
jgi:hypothetical protein